jgi:HNH endonuclease
VQFIQWSHWHSVRRCKICHYKQRCKRQKEKRDALKVPRNCLICGVDFTPFRADQKYCSPRCNSKAQGRELVRRIHAGEIVGWKKKKRQRRRAAMIVYECKTCGAKREVFRRYYIGLRKNRTPRFCSLECWYVWHRKHPRKGSQSPSWRGGEIKFRGEGWHQQAELIRMRDCRLCRICGKAQGRNRFPVDHIVPFRMCKENNPLNLLTVCGSCHARKMGLENCLLRGDIMRFWSGLNAAGWPMQVVADALTLYGCKVPEMLLAPTRELSRT